jgi:hypothetical protein
MDDRTLQALRRSIANWQARVDGTYTGPEGAAGCPLCLLFNRREDSKDDCIGCPVANKVGKKYCEGTPYEMWADQGMLQPLAEQELKFLQSLLPPSGPSHEQ